MTDLLKTSVGNLSVKLFYNVKSRSSFCWKYFGHLILTEGNKKIILNTEQVYCLACLNDVKTESEDITFGSVKVKNYNKTVSTGNLTRHLRDSHQIQCGDHTSSDDKDDKVKVDPTDFLLATQQRAKVSSATSSTKGKTRHHKEGLARDLVLWFCKSLLPFDYVSDEGMIDFFKNYNITKNYDDIPSRDTISGSALSEVYESMLAKVKERILTDAAEYFAITFDFWTNQYRRLNYITFTLHYLTSDFILKTFTLSTEIIIGENTEEKINSVIKDIKKSFMLAGKKIIAVTDAVENIKRGVSLANMTHHLCYGHGLHNLVTVDGIKSIPEITALVKKCKNIVKALTYRMSELQTKAGKIHLQTEFLESLDRIAETLEGDEVDPIPEVDLTRLEATEEFETVMLPSEMETAMPGPTRWHSLLDMLESVNLGLRKPINKVLRKIGQDELRITESEWIILKDTVNFLKGFREAVQIMSSQKTCTLNVALVFRSELIDVLNSLPDDKSIIIFLLKQNMLASVNQRFPVTKAIVAAALLDSRFMSLKDVDVFLEIQQMTRSNFLSSYIKEVMPEILIETSITTNSSNDTDASLLHKLSKKHSINSCRGITDDPIDKECMRYIASADPAEPKDEDLLSYWNRNKRTYPYISALAKALLCVPATSTPSERAFSAAGLSISAKRSRLSPAWVDKMIFIHDNYKISDEKK